MILPGFTAVGVLRGSDGHLGGIRIEPPGADRVEMAAKKIPKPGDPGGTNPLPYWVCDCDSGGFATCTQFDSNNRVLQTGEKAECIPHCGYQLTNPTKDGGCTTCTPGCTPVPAGQNLASLQWPFPFQQACVNAGKTNDQPCGSSKCFRLGLPDPIGDICLELSVNSLDLGQLSFGVVDCDPVLCP